MTPAHKRIGAKARSLPDCVGEDYKAGAGYPVLCKKYGISKETLFQKLALMGIPRHGPGGARLNQKPKEKPDSAGSASILERRATFVNEYGWCLKIVRHCESWLRARGLPTGGKFKLDFFNTPN